MCRQAESKADDSKSLGGSSCTINYLFIAGYFIFATLFWRMTKQSVFVASFMKKKSIINYFHK